MAGEVACLASMTEGKVNTGCIHVGSNSNKWSLNSLYELQQLPDVARVLSEGLAVQRREPAGQRDALWREQTQECAKDHAESRVPQSRYIGLNTHMLHCCEE